jgi:hypothetical protein
MVFRILEARGERGGGMGKVPRGRIKVSRVKCHVPSGHVPRSKTSGWAREGSLGIPWRGLKASREGDKPSRACHNIRT